jgi:hypothetical protein
MMKTTISLTLLLFTQWMLAQDTTFINLENIKSNIGYPGKSADKYFELFILTESELLKMEALKSDSLKDEKKIEKKERLIFKLSQDLVQEYHMAEMAKKDYILKRIQEFKATNGIKFILFENHSDHHDSTIDFLDFLDSK